MKILLVTNLYPPNSIGGYERLCATIAGALATRGHAVRVLTSGHGGGRPGVEQLPVQRVLRLLVSSRSIYEPFEGGRADREEIIEANGRAARTTVEGFRPDVLLAGNLMFLDRGFLEGLFQLGVPVAYLLTDVWLIQMLDDGWLQEYFRREILGPDSVDLTGVQELPGEVLAGARIPVPAAESARRDAVENRLAAGRTAYQLSGVCHLCGSTAFLVRRATPGTLTLPRSAHTVVLCSRCGLDGWQRAVIHAADSLAGERGSPRVGILCSDRHTAAAVGQVHRGRVTMNLTELAGMEVVAELTLVPEGSPTSGAGPRSDQRRVFARPREAGGAGEASAPLLEIWSERYGYLGREYRVGLSPVG
jgi:hypothetical protein